MTVRLYCYAFYFLLYVVLIVKVSKHVVLHPQKRDGLLGTGKTGGGRDKE